MLGAHHQHQRRHHAHRVALVGDVAHHGARDHHAGAAADRLRDPQPDQG
jgi:hypothetical protein